MTHLEIKWLLSTIKKKTQKGNRDNITRTKAYERFFRLHPEIHWSFLAGMVSRNAGWNMCDLAGRPYVSLLDASMRERLFLTYEKANWLIFQDAYPQLLLYHYSTKWNIPLFHLSRYFFVSKFMEEEWKLYWKTGCKNTNRLVYAQIINEQNVIEKPVLKKDRLRESVFRSAAFWFQDTLHFSTVLFPVKEGEVYGCTAAGFKKLEARIELGKRLYKILFAEELFPKFYSFACSTEPTGSRMDYERYVYPLAGQETPVLRRAFPVVSHGNRPAGEEPRIKGKWFQEPVMKEDILLTEWYKQKQKQLQAMAACKALFT